MYIKEKQIYLRSANIYTYSALGQSSKRIEISICTQQRYYI